MYLRLKDEVSKIRGGSISTSVKVELDKDIKNLKDMETRIKNQLDGQQKQIEELASILRSLSGSGAYQASKGLRQNARVAESIVQEVTRLRINDKLAAGSSYRRVGV